MTAILKQNQTDRIYQNVNDFEIRTGKFHNPNEFLQGAQFEIRILHNDPEIIDVLREIITDLLKR